MISRHFMSKQGNCCAFETSLKCVICFSYLKALGCIGPAAKSVFHLALSQASKLGVSKSPLLAQNRRRAVAFSFYSNKQATNHKLHVIFKQPFVERWLLLFSFVFNFLLFLFFGCYIHGVKCYGMTAEPPLFIQDGGHKGRNPPQKLYCLYVTVHITNGPASAG